MQKIIKMKRLILITFLIMAKINTPFAQGYAANNDTKTYPGITFQNVKTQAINVGGTDFLLSQTWRE